MNTTRNFPKHLSATVLLGAAALLSACGGSSGGNDTPAPGTPPAGTTAKTRLLPAFDVTVTPTKTGTIASSFEVKVSDPANVTALKAAIGADVDSGVAATVTPGASGTWTVAVPASANPDAGLQLQFTTKDGDSVETGTADFPLK